MTNEIASANAQRPQAIYGGNRETTYFEHLTGDTLLAYCETRLTALDTEIKMHMGRQQEVLDSRPHVDNALGCLKGNGEAGPTTLEEFNACMRDLHSEAMQCSDPGTREGLLNLETTMRAKYVMETATASRQYVGPEGGDFNDQKNWADVPTGTHTPKFVVPIDGQWQGDCARVQSLGEEMKGGAEFDMLRLQSLVSQRQTAVQMTTNLMSKLDQSTETIAKNI